MTAATAPYEHGRHMGAAWRVYAFMNLLYLMSMFHRTSMGVLGPELREDLGLSASQLGSIAGAYFLGFALMQIPTGMLLDRFGPRRIVALMMLVPALGSLVFATAQGVPQLVVGQFLIGCGCAVGLMGAIVIFARWFPADRMATMIALYTGLGNLGFMLSATPLAWAVQELGWRGPFAILAVVNSMLVLLAFLTMRDAPPDHPYHSRRPEPVRQVLAGVWEVLSHGRLYPVLALAVFSLSIVIAIRNLASGLYLEDVFGLGASERAVMLDILSAAILVGNVAYGPLDRLLDSRKKASLLGAFATLVPLLALAFVPGPPLWLAMTLLCVVGVVCNYPVTLLAHGRALFPDHLVGRAVTIVNLANFAGIFLLQRLTGALISWFPEDAGGGRPEAAYQTLFGVLAACVALGIVAYLFAKESKPSEDRRR